MIYFQGYLKVKKKDLNCEQGEDDVGESTGENMTCRSRILDLISKCSHNKKSLAMLLMSYNPLRSISLALNLCQTSVWFTEED